MYGNSSQGFIVINLKDFYIMNESKILLIK